MDDPGNDVHETTGRCEGCGARFEPGEIACSMCGRSLTAPASTAGSPPAAAALPPIHREHAGDVAAGALERAHASGRLPALMREEPSRATAMKRQWWLAGSAATALFVGLLLLSITSDSDGFVHRRRSGFGRPGGGLSLRGAGWLLLLGGAGTAVVAAGRMIRIRTLPPAEPRLAWLERSTQRSGGLAPRYTADLRWEDGSHSTLRTTTDAWQLMTSDEVGIAWVSRDRVLHWQRIRL